MKNDRHARAAVSAGAVALECGEGHVVAVAFNEAGAAGGAVGVLRAGDIAEVDVVQFFAENCGGALECGEGSGGEGTFVHGHVA